MEEVLAEMQRIRSKPELSYADFAALRGMGIDHYMELEVINILIAERLGLLPLPGGGQP